MADIATLIKQLTEDGEFRNLANNPLGQFGMAARRYIGAEILPVETREENAYTENGIKYKTIIANSGDRYSPAQIKGGEISGSMDVKFGNYDIARELTGRDLDGIIQLLNRNLDLNAASTLLDFVDKAVNLALFELEEKQRWEALVNAQVTMLGDNGYTEVVNYPNPAGHRVVAAEAWSNDANDPMDAIYPLIELADTKGFTISRIITGRTEASLLSNNAIMRNRSATNDYNTPGRATLSRINAINAEDGIPPIELYGLRYHTQTGTFPFLPPGTMLFIAETGRDQTIDLGDEERIIPNTLGYFGRGRPVGESGPGLVVRSWFFDDKPPRVKNEGWGTGLPVIAEPEAVFAITGIS